MFKQVGRLATAHPLAVCAGWLIAGLLLTQFAPSWDSQSQDDDIRFMPARCPSVRGYRLLEEAFPRDVSASRAIFVIERLEKPLTDKDFSLVDQLVKDLNALRDEESSLQIGSINSYRDGFVGSRLTSVDGRCTLVQVSLGTPYLALQTRTTVDRAAECVRQRLARAGPNAPLVLTTGPAGIGRDLIAASANSLEGTTLATIALVVVVLLLVYRAPLLALVPLSTIAISVWVALKLLALLTLLPGVHLMNISKIFAIVMLYGAGTDYCLFLISRYREELAHNGGTQAAVQRSITKVGGALAASAGTVICGLGLMGLAEFAKVRCAGPAIALGLAVALLASLTLAPALLCLLGKAVFWPQRLPGLRAQSFRARDLAMGNRSVLWDRISRGVVARPVLIWTTAMLALTPLAFLGLKVKPNYKPTGELAPTSDSIRGIASIQRHFTAGETGPLTVLLASPTDWNSAEGREVIAHLSRGFAHLANVAEVRSLTQPLGTPLKVTTPEFKGNSLLTGFLKTVRRNIDGVMEQAGKAAREFYVADLSSTSRNAAQPRFVTRLDVVFRSDPFDSASKDTLELIQTWLRQELPHSTRNLGTVEAECYGVTVSSRDLAEVTEADRARVNVFVLTGIFLILLLLVRRLWLAGYLLATVLFSYYATLGATVLAGYLYSGRPMGLVDWRVPFFLFTILVAVGEDYNILLITRVLQERKRHGIVDGMRRALARTGGTITSCGVIMAGTFATLMLGGLGTLVQIGFALAFGVLLDTFIVRPFLVPAFTLMVWPEEDDNRGIPDGKRKRNRQVADTDSAGPIPLRRDRRVPRRRVG